MDRKMKEEMKRENELYFPEYLKAVKEEADPENIDYRGLDATEDERMVYDGEKACSGEDYGDVYMKTAK